MLPALLLVATLAQPTTSVIVTVVSDYEPVPDADVSIGETLVQTDADGRAVLTVEAGSHTVVVSRIGFDTGTAEIELVSGDELRVQVELKSHAVVEEEIIVTATRTNRRIEDLPLRVEVVPQEEVQEKIMMTPGDISMLLAETNGLRVQTTSPSLGGASVRIQGLRGRYTQILSDGLPLFGGQTGAVGVLQIPPMDLGQVEVIKGVASALYGSSAVGGVVNLVSRRPRQDAVEREVLVNATTHGGTDSVLWLSSPLNERWGATFVGGAHTQTRSDLDRDGWTDLPRYRRFVARPRLFWENGEGDSVMMALGAMTERRRGGTEPDATLADGSTFEEALGTDRFDGGLVGRWLVADTRVLAVRGSAATQRHRHRYGPQIEPDQHHTWFSELSLTGVDRSHTWTVGTALQQDAFRSEMVPRFDYTFTVPAVFVQDELDVTDWLAVSASARLDQHSDYGSQFSPRVSGLIRWGGPWETRVSVGRGFYAPTPFTDETQAVGLSGLAPLGELEAERADSGAIDITWAREPFELTGTVFTSRIRDALQILDNGPSARPLALVNAPSPTRTYGVELVAQIEVDKLHVISTYMFLQSEESDPEEPGRSTRRLVPLTPRHSASLDILWEAGPARIGIELFYTGRQELDDNPYRAISPSYLLYGGLLDLRITDKLRIFANVENLGDVRQTRRDPLLLPGRHPDGRWTVDAWGPIDGRVVNAGIRLGL